MWLLFLILGISSLHLTDCQCTFPTTFTGTWVSSNDGTWIINSTHLLNYNSVSSTTGAAISPGVFQLNYECFENQGDTKYVLKSEEINLLGSYRSVHTCVDISHISDDKLIYYQATEADPSGFQFTILSVYDDVCNIESYIQPYNYHIALKSGTETSALQNCPADLFGSYNYDTCIDVNSNSTSLDVCDSRQQLIFNYTLCNTPQMFSLEGVLDCVHHETSGSISYLTLYNRDSTAPDDNNYFQFVCLAVQLSGGIVYVTASPNRCNDNQNATAISSPGETLQLTSYFLCPITTDDSSTNILPIILGILAALLIIALIVLIICCCYRRKCKKKKSDEEEALSDSESEDEQQKKHDSRRSSKSSERGDEENKSIDSGISEPPVTGRTDYNQEHDDDTKEEEQELVINAEGDKEIEDKNSRPCSGQRSRMSDLPPSTIPPEEDQPLSQRGDEEQINEDDIEDKASEKAEEFDHEPDQTEDIENERTHSEVDQSEPEEVERDEEEGEDDDDDDEEEEEKEGEGDIEEENVSNKRDDVGKEIEDKNENIKEEEANDDDNEEEKEEESGGNEDIEEDGIQENNVDPEQIEDQAKGEEEHIEADTDEKDGPDENKSEVDASKSEDHEQSKEMDDTASQKESDTEAERVKHIAASDEDEAEIERRLVGGKKGKDYITKGGLTTVLVSREEEERKRQKINNKSKKQKMRKLAKKKTGKFGVKTTKGGKNQAGSDDEFISSDDEKRRRGLREAPFLKQYENKKHIEHILDEQHYWSDPEGDKDTFRINDEMSSVLNSDYSSESEEEIIGADGIPVRVKKSKYDKRRKRGDGDDISNADSEYIRLKMLKRAGSVDSMISVEDPDTKDDRKSKRKLNEHVLKSDIDGDIPEGKGRSKTGDLGGNQYNDENNEDEQERTKDDRINSDTVSKTKFSSKRTKTILVKEHSDTTEDSLNEKNQKAKNKSKRVSNGKENYDELSDFCDTDIDKLSDRDSGMDDEEGDIDVLLTNDQQQMIVNMLFDEDMNLRPQFDRDDNGRIVRRLDNSVVYDPHTGRFTYRKRLGQIFKKPRLKRNDKGRPLGGYIEDEFGPKQDQHHWGRTSSARRSQSGKSGRFSSKIRSPSADLKRIRTDGRNVGFSVPDEDIDTIPDGDLEYNKRGRRDIGSAIRRQLNKRLFRKKRKMGSRGSPGALPEVKVRKAWGDDNQVASGKLVIAGSGGGISPLSHRTSGRFAQSSPWAQRKTPAPVDAEQWQMYRDGLQSDRRILENLQDKLNSGDGPFAPREAFVESSSDIGDNHEYQGDDHNQDYDRGHSFFNDDGKLVIRERGCPELKQQKVPLFTIIRRPGDLETSESLNETENSKREVKSAPLQVQDYNGDLTEQNPNEGSQYTSENNLGNRSNDGRYSQMTSIDDNRLRRLLEELYKDKKYFDSYVESKDPQSQEFLHSQGLAEHGRGYLLKRADYWERRGPLPPRPPMTAIGFKMQRQQTFAASRQASEMGYSTMTGTPDIPNSSMPGVVESPRENETQSQRNESRNNTQDESFA